MIGVFQPDSATISEVSSLGGVTIGFVRGVSTTPVIQLWDESRTGCLLFSGEDFSGDIAAFSAGSRSFVDAWRKDPRIFLSRLNGWFCGVFVDLERQTACLFNDRFGMGRVYCAEYRGELYFSSSARAILKILPGCRELVSQSLAEHVSVGCVMQERTLFRGINLLPPASCWTFRADGSLEKARYFDPSDWEQQEPLSDSDYDEELRTVFARILPDYERGAGVGLSLTGGLDSRIILAWSKAPADSLPCYTFGGPYRDCADVRIARELAKVAHQPHQVLEFGNDFFTDFGRLARETIVASDGTMDVSGAVELYMNRLARKIAPIRLTGNYGSEILRCNLAFRPRKLDRALYTPEFNRLIDGAEETYRSESQGSRLSFIAFKQVPWHHFSRYSLEKSILSPRSPFLDNDLVALAYRKPLHLETSAGPLLELIAQGSSRLAAVASDRAHRYGSKSPLNRVRRGWHEFTAKAEYAYDYGMPRWLVHADRMASRLSLEKLFLGRHKFYHFRTWYQRQLVDFLRQLRVGDTPHGCFRDGAVASMIQEHINRRANHTLDLHRAASMTLVGSLTHNA